MLARRIHLLGLPHGQTTAAYHLDGFLHQTRRFAEVLTRLGHTVILYASEENEAPCAELVRCITKAEIAAALGEQPYQTCPFEPHHPLFVTFNARAAWEISSRKTVTDVIATIAGSAQLPVSQQHP